MRREHLCIWSNRSRELALERAAEALDADTDAETVERALRFTDGMAANLEAVEEEILPALAEELETSELSVVMYPQLSR